MDFYFQILSKRWNISQLKKLFRPLAIDLNCFSGWWKRASAWLEFHFHHNHPPPAMLDFSSPSPPISSAGTLSSFPVMLAPVFSPHDTIETLFPLLSHSSCSIRTIFRVYIFFFSRHSFSFQFIFGDWVWRTDIGSRMWKIILSPCCWFGSFATYKLSTWQKKYFYKKN